jgi:ABC-type Fe3+-hydroxamate transport system substrate-binding protein
MGVSANALIDASGQCHEVYQGEPRIVSLVPSITELVCELGLKKNLVGRTGFCIHPRGALRSVPKVGGTKTIDFDKLRSLAPTHVILNIDENTRETADLLKDRVPNLIVTHPQAPLDNIALYRLLGGIFGRDAEAEKLAESFNTAYARLVASQANVARSNVLYLIWKGPWMTVSRDTYISRTLALIGLDTVPMIAADRYPKIDLEITVADAGVVLLSTEPYSFRDKHVTALRALPFMNGKTIELIDGEMTSWYGTRAIAGLDYLGDFRRALNQRPAGSPHTTRAHPR